MEDRLKKEYPGDKAAPYKIMNTLGLMRGSKSTAKGNVAQAKHDANYNANDHDEDDAPKNVLKGLGKPDKK